jgi:beta-galactosidase
VGTQPEQAALARILAMAADQAGCRSVIDEDSNLEITCRFSEVNKYYFIINLSGDKQPLPKTCTGMIDILSGSVLSTETEVEPFSSFIVKEKI